MAQFQVSNCPCSTREMDRMEALFARLFVFWFFESKQSPLAGEHKDMASIESGVVKKMLARFKALESEYHPRVVAPPKLGAAFCAAANAHEGFTAPYCSYAPAGSEGCP